MSHLRFTPAEYRSIAHVRRPPDFANCSLPDFQRTLCLSLADRLPELAGRIGRFERGELRLLHDQLRARKENLPPLAPDDLEKLGKACESVPPTHRFAHLIRQAVLRHLRTASPGLARKVARLGVGRFVRLLEKVQERKSA